MGARRCVPGIAAVAAAAMLLAGCSSDAGSYDVEALFPEAVALFEGSAVQMMGVDVGQVRSVRVEGQNVRVGMRIDGEVNVPTDVVATITPVSLIGERNIVLTAEREPGQPIWQPGMEAAEDGFEIPPDQIGRVVEPDDVLKAVTDLVRAVDPERIASFLGDTAATLEGNGELINEAIEDGAQLLRFVSNRDDDLLATAAELRELAASLNTREDQLQQLFDAYADATGILADERQNVRRLLEALQTLVDEGGALVTVLDDELASGLADLLQVQLRIEANADSVNQFLASLPDTGNLIVDAYREDGETLTLLLDVDDSLGEGLVDLLGRLDLGGGP